jgi:dihydroorotate dehydrogenase
MLHRSILRPLLFRLPPETAHELTVHTLTAAMRLRPLRRAVENRFQTSHFGTLERFGLQFANPVGLGAGFDKTGEASHALAALGFGFHRSGHGDFSSATRQPASAPFSARGGLCAYQSPRL